MSAEPPRVAAIVLAAGRSTRMGQDKALLDLDGEPALGRMLRVLRSAGVYRIIVVTRPVGAALHKAVDLESITTVVNLDASSGQTGSIRIGVQNLPADLDAFLLCPVDVPLFEAEDVRALCAAFAARPTGVAIVVPSVGDRRGHPALFAAPLAAEFRALGDGEPGHAVVRRDASRVMHVALRNPALVADLDTPEDLARAMDRHRGGARS